MSTADMTNRQKLEAMITELNNVIKLGAEEIAKIEDKIEVYSQCLALYQKRLNDPLWGADE